MTRSRNKYLKPLNPEAPCDCSWCNVKKANSEYKKKRDKRDLDERIHSQL